MAHIKNIDPNGTRILPDLGLTVEGGETVEVPDEVAKSLAEQSVWELVDEAKAEAKTKAEEAK